MSASSEESYHSDEDSDDDDPSRTHPSEEVEYDDWIAGEDESQMPTACLLHPEVIMPSPDEALALDKEKGLDLCDLIKTLHLDLYQSFKVINCIRKSVQDGLKAEEIIRHIKQEGPSTFLKEEDDSYLCPVLEDDPLLYALGNILEAHGIDLVAEEEPQATPAPQSTKRTNQNGVVGDEEDDSDEKLPPPDGLVRLQKENQGLREEVAELRTHLARMSELMRAMDDGVKVPRPKFLTPDNDSYYFNSYAHHGIHETMLKDDVRTGAYQEAIQRNQEAIKGKVVLDVGCGTGVLSMFAAKAGAARVIGVDCSDIIHQASKIIKLNKLDDVVSLIKGKMEEVELPVDKVDVIISEWMGYCLLYESMLPSVLFARDKYLAKRGSILPNRCTMIIQGMKDSEGRLDWWSNVYGLDMSPLRQSMLTEPSVEVVDPQAIITNAYTFIGFDLMTIKDADLDFEASFEMQVSKAGPFHGLVLSFDTFFDSLQEGTLEFSTTPQAKPTHWAQTLLWLKDLVVVAEKQQGEEVEGVAVEEHGKDVGLVEEEGEQQPGRGEGRLVERGGQVLVEEGDSITGIVRLTRNRINPRDYDIDVQYQVEASKLKEVVVKGEQKYALSS